MSDMAQFLLDIGLTLADGDNESAGGSPGSPVDDILPATEGGCAEDLISWEQMGTLGFVFGLVLFVVTSASIIPSYTKPLNAKSTFGLSPETLALTNFQQTFQAANVLTLKFPQMRQCFTVGFGACQPSMLVVYQTCGAWLMLFFVYGVVVKYPHPNTEEQLWRNKSLWTTQLVSCFGYIGFLMITSLFFDCDGFLETVGIWSGYVAATLMIFRFAPQLYTTYISKTAGGISYVTYAFVGVGGFLMTFFQAVLSREPVSTWAAVFVGNCFQTVIICVAAYYDCVVGKKDDDKDEEMLTAASEETVKSQVV